MIFVNLLLVAAMAAAVGLSSRVYSPQEFQDEFEKGQKLYALGDYDKAIGHYEAILAAKSTRLINIDEVSVTVDEYILPVRVASTYQLGNTYNKEGLDKLRRSQFLRTERKEEEAEQRYQEALADLGTSLEYFQAILDDDRVDERTRVMAQYQMLETSYQLKRFDQVIQEGRKLLRDFPNSSYDIAAHYDMGWAHYELKQYRQAIQRFEEVLTLSPRGSRADRALFQAAECYHALDEYDQALLCLDRLISRYDFSAMSEQELIQMTTLKLKGLVKETSRELVAKAQIKRGDIFASRGEIDQALAAYAVVPEQYAAESALVQDSYIRTAELLHQQRGTPAAIAAYKNAIENVDDEIFQAQTQLTVARLLLEERQFEQAAEEYRIYLTAYADVAARIGFGQDKVLFRLGECYQSLGRKQRGTHTREAAASLDSARTYYRELLDKHADSPLIPDAYLGLGFCAQLQGDGAEGKRYFRILVDQYGTHPATPTALLQIARLEFEAGDFAAARRVYGSFLEHYSDSPLRPAVYMELGLTCARLGDLPAAIAALETVDPAWEQWPQVQLQLAELYASQRHTDKAAEVLDRALGTATSARLRSRLHYARGKVCFTDADYAAAIGELSASLEPDPAPEIAESALFTRGAAHYELAKELDAHGDSVAARAQYEHSREDLQRVLEGNPPPDIKDSAYRTLGASMIRLHQAREAAGYYQEIISGSDDPQERATFQMLLTELFYDMQLFDQAQAYARQLLAMDFADDAEAGYYRKERAYAIIGNALMQQEAFAAAADTFATGLRLYPDSGESANMAFSKGLAEFSAGLRMDAINSFTDYLKRFPAHPNALHAQYYLAHAYQSLTEFAKAAAAFSTLVERFPDSIYDEEASFLIAENLYNEQDFASAATAYQQYIVRYPHAKQSDDAQYALAWAWFEQEDMKRGVGAMADLVAHFPGSEYASKAQFTIGDYYYNIQSYDQALEAYGKVLSDYPASTEAAKAKPLVAELSEIQASLEYAEVMKLFDREVYSEAAAGFAELVARHPNTYTALAAYCNMAMAYENLHRWDDAVRNYDELLKRAGDDPQHQDVVAFARQHREWIVENRL